jgi:prepilin-type N-terminal cleavage/methylation domain-containing protein
MKTISTQKKLLRNNSGFTLLETMIALLIMVMAFTAILTVESNSIRASENARRLNIVRMLAKNKITEVEQEIEGKSFSEVKKENGGSFKSPYQDYRWNSVVKEIEFPNLSVGAPKSNSSGSSSAAGGGAGSDIADFLTKLLTNFLSKAVREVTVTIHWKRGTSEQNFSLSMYWVDLNHEFQTSL